MLRRDDDNELIVRLEFTVVSAQTQAESTVLSEGDTGDRTAGIKTEKDGSLTITMSSAEPSGADAEANWLPTPKGPFYVVLREYSPGPAVLNGDWLPPKIEKAK